MRLLAALALLAAPIAAGATTITFADLCPAGMRVERDRAQPERVMVFCVGEAQARLTLANCPAPARIESRGNDKAISCPGGPWPVIVRQR